MALSPDFPQDPYAVIDPTLRWYPGDPTLTPEQAAALIPPLVAQIRTQVHEWRMAGYPGISATSQALLRHWFKDVHLLPGPDGQVVEFRYYFAQREAVETAIWLFENQQATDAYSLMRYDSSGLVSKGMFPENWARYVFKLATGAGKTKVLSMLIAWSYFHKAYETGSTLSRNFLLVAPYIIVLDRLLDDFDGLKIYSTDPVIPENGFAGRDWRNDFQLTLHVQDEVGTVSPAGNLFLTNIHRIYEETPGASPEDEDLTDFFLGRKPVTKTTQKQISVGDVVRGVEDLVVLNDEAHHIHDSDLAWFRAIEGIDVRLRQRTGHGIAAQFDVTATPKNENGGVFPQTVCSYPLVEAIRQGVVKTPVVPDEASRAKLEERPSDKVYERYEDHIKLGYLEWAKRRDDLEAAGKKPILFVMTSNTAEADEVAEYIERTYPDLTDKVLTIHTKANGEISDKPGDKELEALREASRNIDRSDSPYLCVVSVLMLREGWDVQNVISMVGLRPYTATSKVLPEQTLGRGLRRMFRGDPALTEYVSVVGTEAFLEFVESVRNEGVELVQAPMGPGSIPKKPLLVEVDKLNPDKDIDQLDFSMPKLAARIGRQMKNLDELDIESMPEAHLVLVEFTPEEQREIVFKDLDTDRRAWATDLGEAVSPTSQAVVAYLTMELMRRLRLVGGQATIFGKLSAYIKTRLFDREVDLDDPNVLRNLSEFEPRNSLYEVFADAINSLTIVDSGETQIIDRINLSRTRPSLVNNQEFIQSDKTLFNRVVGDSLLELRFAAFLDRATDVQAFVKNGRNAHFFIEYVTATGEISNYYPDFLVRTGPDTVYVVETKGLEDLDVAPKWHRLVTWCADATALDGDGRRFVPLYVPEDEFDDFERSGASFKALLSAFRDMEPVGA